MPPRLLVEARPGAGKTTVLRRLVELLRAAEVPASGFTTEELREGGGGAGGRRGRRVGFAVESLDGRREVLAHVSLPGPPRVGRYGVDLDAFERTALPALDPAAGGVVVIDELGKMELASERFRHAIEELLAGPAALVASVQATRHPFTDRLKQRRDVELIRLRAANRDVLPGELARRLGAER